MAEDDIYGNRGKYDRLKSNLTSLLHAPSEAESTNRGGRKYYCRNSVNLRHFRTLFSHVEARDLSFIRRVRLLQCMRTICHLTSKDLADCSREDIDGMVAAMHTLYRTPKSKETFIKEMKYLWKMLFPEKDERGRSDETIVPYVVRQLSARSDKSREKLRRDKLSWEEFERLVNYFGSDLRMQAYLTFALESLGRPQEVLFTRIRDVELHDHYAKVYISEHGKEGTGLLQCIDSYPYLLRWLEVHPLRKDDGAFLFLNTGGARRCEQMRPGNVNKLIRKACKDLGIDKPITCYSLKRNGVTIRRLRGETDMEIQHAARWTSTKQLKVYDLTNQDEAFKRELEKRGLVPSSNGEAFTPRSCGFCGESTGFGATLCQQCKRPLDRRAVVEEGAQKDNEIRELRQQVTELAKGIDAIKRELIPSLMQDILDARETRQRFKDSRGSESRSSRVRAASFARE